MSQNQEYHVGDIIIYQFQNTFCLVLEVKDGDIEAVRLCEQNGEMTINSRIYRESEGMIGMGYKLFKSKFGMARKSHKLTKIFKDI